MQVQRYACSAPQYFTSLEIQEKSSTAITIGWKEPLKSLGCPISGYTVQADDGLFGDLQDVTLPDSAASLPATQFSLEISTPAVHTLVVGR